MHPTADIYLDSLDGKAAATDVEYRRELKLLFETFPTKEPAEFTPMDVEVHLHRRCQGRSASTRKKAIAILRSYFAYLHERGAIPTNPVRIKPPQIPPPDPSWWTPEEVRRILSAPMHPRDHLLLETLARTGQRLGVVRTLHWHQVRTDLRDPELQFERGKRGKKIPVPMDKELIHDFMVYRRLANPAPEDWVFKSRQGDGCLSVQQVNRIIHVACRKAQVRVASAHEFRRSCATNLLHAGAPLDVVSRDILGHSNIETTIKHYRGAESERVRVALRGLPY